MKAGDRVDIYQKPLTGEDYEGEAVIVSMLSDEPCEIFGGVKFYRARVHFDGDGPSEIVKRIVGEEDVLA